MRERVIEMIEKERRDKAREVGDRPTGKKEENKGEVGNEAD